MREWSLTWIASMTVSAMVSLIAMIFAFVMSAHVPLSDKPIILKCLVYTLATAWIFLPSIVHCPVSGWLLSKCLEFKTRYFALALIAIAMALAALQTVWFKLILLAIKADDFSSNDLLALFAAIWLLGMLIYLPLGVILRAKARHRQQAVPSAALAPDLPV